jgi:hypothetical protein
MPALGASRICMSADTLTFGQREAGSTTSASVTVSNCGDAAFAFTDVSAHTATNAAYRIDTQCVTGMTLAPRDACTVGVTFRAANPGSGIRCAVAAQHDVDAGSVAHVLRSRRRCAGGHGNARVRTGDRRLRHAADRRRDPRARRHAAQWRLTAARAERDGAERRQSL